MSVIVKRVTRDREQLTECYNCSVKCAKLFSFKSRTRE